MFVLSACMSCIMFVSGTHRGQKRKWDPWDWRYRQLWESIPGPVEEQAVPLVLSHLSRHMSTVVVPFLLRKAVFVLPCHEVVMEFWADCESCLTEFKGILFSLVRSSPRTPCFKEFDFSEKKCSFVSGCFFFSFKIFYLIFIYAYVFWSNPPLFSSLHSFPILPSFFPNFICFFFKNFNTCWIHLVLPVCVWMWDHPLALHFWRKLTSPYPSSHQLLIASQTVVGHYQPLPSLCWDSGCLILGKSWAVPAALSSCVQLSCHVWQMVFHCRHLLPLALIVIIVACSAHK